MLNGLIGDLRAANGNVGSVDCRFDGRASDTKAVTYGHVSVVRQGKDAVDRYANSLQHKKRNSDRWLVHLSVKHVKVVNDRVQGPCLITEQVETSFMQSIDLLWANA
jgi:hypothetical protein